MREAQARVDAAGEAVARFEKGLGSYDDCDAKIRAALTAVGDAEPAAVTPQHRQRLAAMGSECETLSQSARVAQSRLQHRAKSASEREQLLRNRATGGHDFENIGHAAAGGTENTYLDRERDSLQHTARDVARMTEESTAVLDALRSQRRRMEGTAGKLEGVLQGLGVSDQAIRQIRSMNATDAAIVAGGTALLILLMLYLWFA
uniref:Uncharacterized protein n=1 Tax=Neobodo designis TaxID=312471 RepID=A0A7S1QGC2_NEODS|mmetsp:Transcript_45207/g.139463  ORF Transcript_45207/g.139463 Transcript_45207/m.139463 type:complete len:204 (+) Transcript_45207:26-637(+)